MEEQNLISNLSFDNTEVAFKHLSNKELKKSYWLFKTINNNILAKLGPFLTKTALFFRLPISGIIKSTIFKQFCGGETISESTKLILRLFSRNVGTILDYSVEGEVDERSFDHTAEQILNSLNKAVEMPEAIPFCVFKVTGFARLTLLEKIAKKEKLHAFEELEWQKALNRVDLICKTAAAFNKRVMVDAEETWVQDVIDDVAIAMIKKYNKQQAIVFNTYQLYRIDKLTSLIADLTIAKTHEFILGAKLVRGAYLEKERFRASEKGYLSPIHSDKHSTDRDFDAAVSFCLDNITHVVFVVATHNQHSCEVLLEKMEQRQIAENHPHIYFAQLLGMSDNISFNLANYNFNVAKYVPYGPVKSVLSYLFRRAEENTSIAGQMGRELGLISKELVRRKKSLVH